MKILAAFALSALSTYACAQLNPPNLVEITPKLSTSGQPSAETLAGLGAQGYAAVIYLAPTTVGSAVKDEAAIIGKQNLVYVNIPIIWDTPTEADFNAFVAALRGMSDRRVLVHCQVNMRASAMTFLYRSIVLKEDPKQAYEAVAKIWAPNGTWKRYMQEQLRKNDIKFELY